MKLQKIFEQTSPEDAVFDLLNSDSQEREDFIFWLWKNRYISSKRDPVSDLLSGGLENEVVNLYQQFLQK